MSQSENLRTVVSFLLLLLGQSFSSCVVAKTPALNFIVNDFEVMGENKLSEQRIKEVLAPFVGEHQGLAKLNQASQVLEQAHAQLGYTFHRVVLPPQTLASGAVKLEVVRFALGQIEIEQAKYFSRKQIIRSLPFMYGDELNTRQIKRQLELANRHPNREHLIHFKKGQQANTVDADVKVKDSRPYMGFVLIDNTGSSDSGRVRPTLGGQHNNITGHDDSLTLSYSTSYLHPEKVKQYGVNYSLPLYDMASKLNLLYSKSDVDSGTINSLDISGAGQVFGVSLEHTLLPVNNYSHNWSVAIIDKLFENNALFSGTNLASDVRSRPVSVTYRGQYSAKQFNIGMRVGLSSNISSGNKNSDLDYELNRAGATSDWQRWNIDGSASYFFDNNWLFHSVLQAQLTDDALIPGEQFGLGGARSVRGFEERAVTADSGLRISTELWTPEIARLFDGRLLAFVDYGYMDREHVLAGEEGNDNILSVGFGGRWNWQQTVQFNLDYGRVLNSAEHLKATLGDGGNTKLHMSLLFRY